MGKESFKKFRDRVMHKKDSLFANLFLNPITIRLAYLVKKYDLNITANQVSYTRLFILSPLIIFLLFLAPLIHFSGLYMVVAILFYLTLITDWLDGSIARGLNSTSEKGAFLDSVADRTAIIIFITMITSIGLFTKNSFLIYGGIFLFIIKIFNLMVISKIFYSNMIPYKQMDSAEKYKDKNMLKLFGGETLVKLGINNISSFLEDINQKYLKIKRWNPKIIVPERYFITIMVPLLLIYFKLDNLSVYLLSIFVVAFSFFFLLRIKNLFDDYL